MLNEMFPIPERDRYVFALSLSVTSSVNGETKGGYLVH